MGGGLAGLETAPPRPDRQAVAQPVPMALLDLLYRCPECGHDPMDGKGTVSGVRRAVSEFGGRGVACRLNPLIRYCAKRLMLLY